MTEEQKPYDVSKLTSQHAADVGRITIFWNGLHDALGELFAEVVSPRGPRGREIALAAWQAVPNDQSKRLMLKAVCVAALGTDSEFIKEVTWAIDQINPLEDKRNNAVHSPYAVTLEGGELRIVPSMSSGSKRARKLHGKDLEAELTSYAEHIAGLTWFVFMLLNKSQLKTGDSSWPQRPPLRRTAQATDRKSRSPQTAPR